MGAFFIEFFCGPDEYLLSYGNGHAECLPSSPARNAGRPQCNGTNPINTATGNKFQEESVWRSTRTDGFEFSWYYNSDDAGFAVYNDREGKSERRWFNSYALAVESDFERALENPTFDFGLFGAVVKTRDGRAVRFTNAVAANGLSTADELWTPESTNVRAEMRTLEDPATGQALGFRFTDSDGVEYQFSLEGDLNAIKLYDGHSLTLERTTEGQVSTITSDLGEQLTFLYEASQLTGIQQPDGEITRFEYNTDGNVQRIIWPDATPGTESDNPDRTFHYEDTRFPSHLTGTSAERGNRVATWSYDDQGRAVSSEHADGADDHFLTFNADGTTTVADPKGQQRTYSFTNQQGVFKVESVTGGDCSQCGADAASYTYDTNGFLASKTDFNGNVTTYVRDARGRELSRIEAEGTSEARTITTTWHPDLNKPASVSKPGRLTSYSYDPNGHLLAKTEQPQP